ncbi:MAG: DUF3370 domain-containing protein [Coleofasciculaceae cyanobacterium]
MLSLFSFLTLAQLNGPIPPPPLLQEQIVQPQEVRPLPGQLDKIPVFNSNSPEVIQTPGILLSSFPGSGKLFPNAHLNWSFVGRFDLFSHHIARAATIPGDWRPLYQAVIVHNPGSLPVTLDILQAVSYVTNPDAPFIDLPAQVDNATGKVFSGPGSRLATDILRGVHQSSFPSQLVIPPRQSRILFNLPIATGNARSTLMRLRSNRPVYMANLAMVAQLAADLEFDPDDFMPLLLFPPPSYRPPNLQEWLQLLINGNLAGPRDRSPTPPNKTDDNIIYGRVAGVAQGSVWRSEVVDRPGARDLSIPKSGQAFSYPLSTFSMVTLGTGQVQSAPLSVRYPDTAYLAHGNYGVLYSLTLPLLNTTGKPQTVTLAIQTPDKQEDRRNELHFLEPPEGPVFFRGTVQVSYKDDLGVPKTIYLHLEQRRGEQGKPLVVLNLPPGDRRLVKVEFIYPPDAQPPQALTIKTLPGN